VDTALSPADCAADYSRRLAAALPAGADGVPRLDLVLAGMGEDGHVASLFPDHALLAAPPTAPWVVHLTDSPKPPPTRATVTMPVLAAARSVAFVAAGGGKADVLAAILGGLLGRRTAATSLRGAVGGAEVAGAGAAVCFPSGRVAAGARAGHTVHWIVDEAAAGKWS